MKCLSCGSDNQHDFSAEIHIHFPFRQDLVKPGVFLFPKVLVCLNCGALSLSIPEMELRELAASRVETGRSAKPDPEPTIHR